MADPVPHSIRAQERLAATLALIAGFVDAYGFLRYQTYVSFMSANTTQTGLRIGQLNLSAALPHALAILIFVTGVFAGTLFLNSGIRHPQRWAFACVAFLLLAAILAAIFSERIAWISLTVLSFSMGFMNTTLSHVGRLSVNLVFVTGTLNNMARNFALAVRREPLEDSQGTWDNHSRRGGILLTIYAGFLGGALLSTLGSPVFGEWILLFPLVILLVLAMVSPAEHS